MVKEFQPYLDLWTTASDWLRWSESWMNDPLSAIDAEQLEKNVIESFKTMHKCVKQFKDIPGSWDSSLVGPMQVMMFLLVEFLLPHPTLVREHGNIPFLWT